MECYVDFGPSAATSQSSVPITSGILRQRDFAGYGIPTRLLPARRINPACSRKAKLIYGALRQCAGNRRRSGRQAKAVRYFLNRLRDYGEYKPQRFRKRRGPARRTRNGHPGIHSHPKHSSPDMGRPRQVLENPDACVISVIVGIVDSVHNLPLAMPHSLQGTRRVHCPLSQPPGPSAEMKDARESSSRVKSST